MLYEYIEIDNKLLKDSIEINKDSDVNILIFGMNYKNSYKINWNYNSLEYYNKILKNDQFMFINCDMYDDFLEYKISIKKKNNKLYLNSVKHIMNLKIV